MIFLTSSLLGFLYVLLTLNVIKKRTVLKISIGHGNNIELEKAIRAHANLCESTPFTMGLLFISYYFGYETFAGILSVIYFISRCIHAYSINMKQEKIILRVISMISNFIIIISSILLIIIHLLIKF